VDEADSVLVDESRTPLIISGSEGGEEEQRFIREAYELSTRLVEGEDFIVDSERRQVDLSEQGRKRLEAQVKHMGPLWRGAIRREEIVHKALLARYIHERDRDYLLRDGKIELIDQLTGRVMEGRSWEKGLHQMVELKEGCELTQQRQTLARISYQNFFRRYLYLSGMTGTARQLRREFWRTYGLLVRRVPTNRPSRRIERPWRVYARDRDRWEAVIRRCRWCVARGQAVLIGTSSVRQSEEISALLRQAGVAHQVLSAKQDKAEAEVIAQAGQPSQVTVATSMAGRGTDIRLAPEVAEAGGLHVIQVDLYESARVDRQLAGRCARQGDPGVYEVMLSMENRVYATRLGRYLACGAEMIGLDNPLGRRLACRAVRAEQKYIERQNYHAREATLAFDRQQRELMAFCGLGE
jgi:preprotein translocase subunit SecA